MSKQYKLNIKKGHQPTIKKIKTNSPFFSKIEEMRYNPEKPGEKEIQVHCKNHNCPNSKEQGGWFTPEQSKLLARIYALEKCNNDVSNLYCSIECQNSCPLFGKKTETLIIEYKIIYGEKKISLYTSEEYNIWRQEVLKRADYLCEYCGEPAIHSHHSRPQKLEPGFVLDPDFGIACCKECHYKYGHETGTECSTGNLAYKICN
jgi:hypothetical protein